MRRTCAIVLAVVASASTLAAQPTQPTQSAVEETAAAPQKQLALASCTSVSDGAENRFTITQPRQPRRWYRSAGTLFLETGQRIQITGGLLPTPNIAAQAGSIDPTVPAMSYASGEWRRSQSGLTWRRPAVRIAEPDGVRVDCRAR